MRRASLAVKDKVANRATMDAVIRHIELFALHEQVLKKPSRQTATQNSALALHSSYPSKEQLPTPHVIISRTGPTARC